MLCSRCKKRPAVVFITKVENDQSVNEGLCLSCAKELGIKPVDDLLNKMGMSAEDIEQMEQQMEAMIPAEGDEDFEPGGAATFPFLQNIFGAAAQKGEQAPNNDKKNEKKEDKKRRFLSHYCTNLTERAANGALDNIIGRDREIYRVIQILSRRTKNNPCLIGEPGVGKTAIAEGLALRIVAGNVPPRLQNKQIYLLDLTALVAGTQFRGQFESRIKGLIEEVKSEGNVILFIDEVHNLVGTGDAEGSMSAANILKPALSRGELQVIGATTFREYRKHIEKDVALERRFQPVTVEEPSIEDTVEILKGIRRYYEEYHGVCLSDALIGRAVELAEQYITDRYLPDKAIDLLDEACAAATLENKTVDQYAKALLEQQQLQKQEEELLGAEQVDYEKLANVRAQLAQQQQLIDGLRPQATACPVSDEHLARVVELWTGIPATKIQQNELSRLGELEQTLKQHIIGQDEAVSLVAAAIRRSRVRISPRRHPASFLFVGPTGVGKTELVKVLAKQLFQTPETLIRLDMSEFMEKHSVSRIIGSPPGYVGYDEAGQLTEKVRRKPYSVLLFDEIEKAHPDVLNILLQILDEGRITDAQGRTVNFENTVIVMTSNAGSHNSESLMGFGRTEQQSSREKAMKALSEFLRPEFIGRIDEIVCFTPLSEQHFASIAVLMLQELQGPLAQKGIRLVWDEKVPQMLAKRSYAGKRGARDLRNAVRREVEDGIASLLVQRADQTTCGISLSVQADETITVNAI